MQDRPAVTYIENWRNPESVLTYCDSRFEISLDQNKIDPLGQNSWETAGALLAIDDQVYIRAYHDTTFGDYKLINVEGGAVYSGRQTNRFWSFLAWKIWIRDPTSKCDTMLLEFDVSQLRQSTG